MLRVYIAGPYSADNVITVLNNMRVGMRVATKLMLNGFAPFCPFLDYQFQLMLRKDENLTLKHYYDYSMAWLEVSDAIVVLEGWENSNGTLAEIGRAKELNTPVYYGINDFLTRTKDKIDEVQKR
jgi:hypothetical protein